MLSTDRFEPRGARRSARDHAARERAQFRHPDEPWDAQSAEALTCLYETDEGALCRPPGSRAGGRAQRQSPALGGGVGVDAGAWLEARLHDFGRRLQDKVASLDPERAIAALGGRLEAIEERFGTALGRVAQRADLDGLRSIEAHVLELAAQIEQSRDRLAQIGSVDERLRGIAQRLDEGEGERLGTLGKLLRDHVAEWREREQRTASALRSLEETIGRLGDSVDAMEASRPAPDLSLSALAASKPEPTDIASDPLALTRGGGARAPAPRCYHARLEADDYAPEPVADALRPQRTSAPPAQAGQGRQASPAAAVAWSATPADADSSRPAATGSQPGGIMALRAELRRIRGAIATTPDEQEERPPPGEETATPRRTRLGLLLVVAVTFLAGAAYLLLEAFTAAAPPAASPVRIKAGVETPGAAPHSGDPAIWAMRRERTS